MNPTLGSAKVDKLLSQFSQKYTNDEYISELIAPPMRVKEKTGKYAKYGTENLRTYSDQLFRAPGTQANSVDYTVSQGEYVCRERALEKRVPDEMVNNTDDPYDPKRDAVATIMDNIWVNQERALALALTSTSVITQNVTLAGTDQWSDYTNSTPIEDINLGKQTIRAATGKLPNSVTMSYDVMQTLKAHPDVREQVKYTNGGQFTDEAFIAFLRGMFGFKNVYIGSAIMNSADEGQTASLGNVWNDDFVMFYKNDRPTLGSATFAYTFFDVPRQVDMYRDEPRVSDVVRVRYSYDQNLMDTSLAYLIKNAIA